MSLQRKHAGENPNQAVVEMLVELADYERNVTRALHKSNAYRKVGCKNCRFIKLIVGLST